jgi:phosphopantothenoylcysteine decarboxylase/phosphopantothenate--cysteine ligase
VQPGPLAGRRLIVGVSGSIAAYKSVHLVRRLVEAGAEVHVALTRAAARFVTPLTFATVSGRPVLSDLFDAVPGTHVTLAEAADAAVVAPATAHLMARMAHGLADDALTTLLLALRGPVLLAPAMESGMWDHPATRTNEKLLRERGVRFVGPETGPLASGLSGPGRMAEPEAIRAALEDLLAGTPGPAARRDLAGERVLVTAGPTREPIDPVRFISSPSTGRMGFAVAEAAAARGAEVTLVAGPVELPTPPGVRRVDVVTAAEMHDAVLAALPEATVLVMAAAVSDFRPAEAQPHKVKKEAAETTLALARTDDILARVAARAPAGLLKVGFAAETRDLEAHARAKRAAKDLDLIVANDVGAPDRGGIPESGFAAETNRVTLIGRDGRAERMPLQSKRAVAEAVLDRVAALRPGTPAAARPPAP